jgi:hypothetical protein
MTRMEMILSILDALFPNLVDIYGYDLALNLDILRPPTLEVSEQTTSRAGEFIRYV